MAEGEWSAPHVLEMLDRDVRALKELLTAEVRRGDEELETQVARWTEQLTALRDHINTLSTERGKAAEKFEGTVSARFVQQNEFRSSLDDLSKSMATRRELETSVENIKDETATALAAANGKVDELTKGLTELRSRLDTGAPAGYLLGQQQRGEQITTQTLVILGIAATFIGALIGHLVK